MIRIVRPRKLPLKKRLAKIGVINTWDLLKKFGVPHKTDIVVSYYPPESRSVRPARSHVSSPSHRTDPKASWYDYGNKSFPGYRDESVPEAVKWATETYGITEWAVDPTDPSGRVPKVVRDMAVAALTAYEKEEQRGAKGPRSGG